MESRLDFAIRQRFCYSREYAKEIILKGYVLVDGKVIYKPSFKVYEDSNIVLNEMSIPKYVSRGGFKLEGAIQEFKINLNDKTCLDIGSSTGGFSDCMLQNGAKKVYAIDVGSNQLHNKILNDSRVLSFENTDIRSFDIDEKIDFICVDVSFISLGKISNDLYRLLHNYGEMVMLIKPQFEVGRENIDKNGIVKNKNVHIKAIQNIIKNFECIGFYTYNLNFSSIKGSKGNIEYLIHMKKLEYIFNLSVKDIVFQAFEILK